MRLWKKLGLFLLLNALVASAAALTPRGYTSGVEYLREEVVFDYLRSREEGDAARVILGDSRAECCISAGAVGFVNLSLSGSTPVEGFYVLRELYARGVDVPQAILAYSPLTVFGQKTFYSRTRYFGFVDAEFIEEVEGRARRLQDSQYSQYHWRALEVIDTWFPFLPDDWKVLVVHVLSLDEILKAAVGGLVGRGELPEGHLVVADPRVKLYRGVSSTEVNRRGVTAEKALEDASSPVNLHYLREIVRIASDHGTELSFLVMPLNEGVLQPGPAYFARFEELVDSVGLAACYSGIQFWPNDFFVDPTHLNQRGVERFDQALSAEGLAFCRP